MAGARATSSSWQLELETVEQRTGYLLASRIWSDCSFVVGSESNQAVVPAHKLVLAMASPVFEAMFFGGLSERNNPIIPIPDVQPEAFGALLEYIYTGKTDIDSFNMAWDLWYVAKKYMLPHLLQECRRYICSVVSPCNACRIYECARFFEDKKLMDKCIQIIKTNTKEVLNDISFMDVELNTILTVLSLDYLDVESELDLINAVARYAKEHKMQGVSPTVEEPPSEKLSKSLEPQTSEEKVLFVNVEDSLQRRPAVELDSKKPTKEYEPEPPLENVKEVPEVANIRAALEKLRFLALTPDQFAEGPARSGLLTKAESFAVFMNIVSRVSDEPMPSGFSECRERRQALVNEQPNAKPRWKPNAFGGFSVIKLTIPETVQGLLSHDRESLEDAARAARHMTCDITDDGTTEKLTQLVAAGGIPLLGAALDQPWSGVQYDAAWAITNIATAKEHVMELVQGDAVSKLVGLLGSVGVVAEQAAWALGNIVADGHLARDAVVNSGALPKLQALLQPETTPKELTTYLWTYRIICQNKTPFELVAPALPNIKKLLFIDDEEVLVEACWVLFHLTDGLKEFNNLGLFARELTTRVTALLEHDAPKVRIAALGATANMLGDSELKYIIFEAGGLDHIINFLKSGNAYHVEEAARATVLIMASSHAQIQKALDKRILDPLGVLLTDGNRMCKWHAACAISTFSYFGSIEQVSMLAAAAMLEPFCRLLAAPECTHPVLVGIASLLQKSNENKIGALCLKLREIGVPKNLLTLQQHEDKQIREGAVHLLETYFPDEIDK